ncbi:hypothetical protein EBR03_02190 [bacterium]|nr:hypothetical protein [bacterium]NBX83125.1 hypothetical protein [bacterium]
MKDIPDLPIFSDSGGKFFLPRNQTTQCNASRYLLRVKLVTSQSVEWRFFRLKTKNPRASTEGRPRGLNLIP